MNYLQGILIVAGISLDLLATMEVEGAKLGEIRRKTLLLKSLLITGLQLGFFFGGYYICHYIDQIEVFANEKTAWLGEVIAFLVFALLGVRLFVKAIRHEFVDERRETISRKTYVRIILVTTIYTLFAGCATGFLEFPPLFLLITIIICSIIVVFAGVYMGYMFGFRAKTVFYAIGAAVLWAAGVNILYHLITRTY